jgi:hypothetical protein
MSHKNPIVIRTYIESASMTWPVPVEDVDAVITHEAHSDELEGYIHLELNSAVFMNERHLDNIVMLWGLIANELPAFFGGQTLSTNLPDQPITLTLKPAGRWVEISRTGDGPELRQRVDRAAFNQAIRAAAHTFFEHLPTFAPAMRPLSTHYLETLTA